MQKCASRDLGAQGNLVHINIDEMKTVYWKSSELYGSVNAF